MSVCGICVVFNIKMNNELDTAIQTPMIEGDASDRAVPLLSVILTKPAGFDVLRRTLSHLRTQTVCDKLELVIVAPRQALSDIETDQLHDFAWFRVVEIDHFRSIGRANAAGIRAAAAPVVALAEDHCFPDPAWAEKLISAHQGPWAAVGPGVENANPNSIVSWADLLIGYGPWLTPSPRREAEFLPGHNSSYKRAILLEYGNRLETMMEAETILHWNLKEQGHRLLMESEARVAHTNFSLWRSWLPAQFYNGRLFASIRSRRKSPAWRVLYFLGSPLIPIVRLWRIWIGLPSRELRIEYLFALHALIIGLAVDGAGQMLGYASGAGNARDKVANLEVDRFRHIHEQDRIDIFAD